MAVKIEKVVQMNHDQIIRFQLMTYCFENSIKLSDSELSCLSLLIRNGACSLTDFIIAASSKSEESILPFTETVFKTPQVVRNFLTKAERSKLIIKTGKNIEINSELPVHYGDSLLYNLKLVYIAS